MMLMCVNMYRCINTKIKDIRQIRFEDQLYEYIHRNKIVKLINQHIYREYENIEEENSSYYDEYCNYELEGYNVYD